MQRALSIVLVLGAAGCHIVTGFDNLTLRDGAEHEWSSRWGDQLPQSIDDVVVSPNRLRVAGQLQGAMELGEATLTSTEPTRFLAQLDNRGGHDWALALEPAITHHGLIANTGRATISYEEDVSIADLSLTAVGATSFAVVDVAGDGASADLVFSGATPTLVNAHVVQVPEELGILAVGMTYEGSLAFDDMGSCEALSAEDQNIAIGRVEDRECSWLRGFGDGQNQWIDSVAADRAGNIVVAGRFQGELDFGGKTSPLLSLGGTDFFIVKLSEDGEALWAHRYGDIDRDQRPLALAVRPSGTITIAGYFDGHVDFGSGAQAASLGHDVFVAKLDPSGNTVWTRHFPVRNDAPADMEMEDNVLREVTLSVDKAGNTLLAGHFRATVDFGGTVRVSEGGLDMFLVKLDVDGLLTWSDSFGDESDQCDFSDCVTALATDSSDSILLGGGFSGTMNLGGNDLESAGASDAFLAKFGR